jgi:hypothetical protein
MGPERRQKHPEGTALHKIAYGRSLFAGLDQGLKRRELWNIDTGFFLF